MELRNDVDLVFKKNTAYLKIGAQIYKILTQDSKIVEYFKLIKDKNFDENLIINNNDFSTFKDFLYNNGAFISSDPWESNFLQYNVGVQNFNTIMRTKKVLVVGDTDLVDFFEKTIQSCYKITKNINEKFDYAVILSRKFHTDKILKLNETLLKYEKVIFPLILDELNVFIGPLIIPNETACLNCVLNRNFKSLIYKDEFELFESKNVESNQTFINPIMLQAISFLNIEIIKRVLFDQKVGIEQSLLNTVIEFSFLESKIEEHNILRDPDCTICINPKKLNVNTIWYPKIL